MRQFLEILRHQLVKLRGIIAPGDPVAFERAGDGGILIALVKPQFEATKAEATAGKGVIKDPAIHERIVPEINNFVAAELAGAKIFGETKSPLLGGDGNREFLIGLRKDGKK